MQVLMDFVSMIPSFFLILLAELGDKTQLMVISLSCRYSAAHVFAGSMLGFLVVDGLSILAGGALTAVLPLRWIGLGAGVVFIVFGVYTVFQKEEDEKEIRKKARFPLLASFYLVAISELGDKTQIASIALAAEAFWLAVLVGVMLAFTLLVTVAVIFGAGVLSRLPRRWLKRGSAALFLVLGMLSIASALLDIQLI